MSRAMEQPYVARLTVFRPSAAAAAWWRGEPGRGHRPSAAAVDSWWDEPAADVTRLSGGRTTRPVNDRLRDGDCVADVTAIPSSRGPLAAAARDPGQTSTPAGRTSSGSRLQHPA